MKNNRSLILINKEFQLKFSFFITSLVFVSSLIYPAIIYTLFQKILPPGQFEENIWSIISILAVMQIVFAAIIFILALFQSHKIAGPLYKLNKTLLEVASGHPLGPISFRKDDNFMEIADSYNQAMQKVKQLQLENFAKLAEISSYIKNISVVLPQDKKEVANKIIIELDEIQKRLE